jgi:type VI secretion system protein ImpA
VYAPDLSVLQRLLRHVAIPPGHHYADDVGEKKDGAQQDSQESAALAERPTDPDESEASTLPEPSISRPGCKASDRHAALNLIREARQWFEQHEPSSPIPVLLKRAEQFVGKRYVDVVKAIPAELLVQWEQEE